MTYPCPLVTKSLQVLPVTLFSGNLPSSWNRGRGRGPISIENTEMEPGDFLVIYSSCAVFRNPCSSLLPSNMSGVLDGWSFWAGKGRTAWDVSWTFHVCLTLFHFQAWCHGLALLISDNLRSFLPSSFQTAVWNLSDVGYFSVFENRHFWEEGTGQKNSLHFHVKIKSSNE